MQSRPHGQVKLAHAVYRLETVRMVEITVEFQCARIAIVQTTPK